MYVSKDRGGLRLPKLIFALNKSEGEHTNISELQDDLVEKVTSIAIFGASGDLTRRKLIPSLHTLRFEGYLSEQTRILGIARRKMSDESFREHLYKGVEDHSRIDPRTSKIWEEFSKNISYLSGDYDDPETYRNIAKKLAQDDPKFREKSGCLFYLSTPPVLYPTIIKHLGQGGLVDTQEGWRRIIIEKPFGRDLNSSRDLNRQVHEVFDEDSVYRIDHYLGKETVQNILTFRFANTIFEPVWNRNYIDHVQITMSERDGVGHRAGYYEGAGVVRDMLQNHLLQLLTLTAMEPPVAFNATALRNEKIKVLEGIRGIRSTDYVLGQYDGYRSETGVDPESRTPTYIALRVFVDNWRWDGVPFYLRTGKRLARKTTEIGIQFKRVPFHLFSEQIDPSPNHISLCIQPDEGHHLGFKTKVPGSEMVTTPVDMEFHYRSLKDKALPEAYERLLLDALSGDASLFARGDEIELAWSIIGPILEQENQRHSYSQLSEGPREAEKFIQMDGRRWELACVEH